MELHYTSTAAYAFSFGVVLNAKQGQFYFLCLSYSTKFVVLAVYAN